MSTEFRKPTDASRQIAKAGALAKLFLGQELPSGADADDALLVVQELGRLIGRSPCEGRFDADRLDRGARSQAGLGLSRRRYNKLFRLAGRLEKKAKRLRLQSEMFDLVLVGKAGLAPRLSVEDFGGDLHGAAFVAYYAARMKLRSEFTIAGQQRPFDEFAAQLFAMCERRGETSWWAIAHVFPRSDVLARLTQEQRGRLLGAWFGVLQTTSGHLARAQTTNIDLATMIVRRGNDSSTWNIMAGAFNRARDHWIALLEAMGADAILDSLMPGKVLRLMAADVAAWHRREGGDVHPDTVVWRGLPKPWEVLHGDAECTRRDIEAACLAAGVEPLKSGWTSARPRTRIAEFRPTPELVHGVAVTNPYLAAYLRQIGAFSGRPLKAHLM